jgi:hypothetical protein
MAANLNLAISLVDYEFANRISKDPVGDLIFI